MEPHMTASLTFAGPTGYPPRIRFVLVVYAGHSDADQVAMLDGVRNQPFRCRLGHALNRREIAPLVSMRPQFVIEKFCEPRFARDLLEWESDRLPKPPFGIVS